MAVRTPPVSTGRKMTLPKPKRRFPPEVLTDVEVRALIEACPATSATGLRIAEALYLYSKDVDL